MRIAVINEISAAAKNADILKALESRGFEVLNLGNTMADDPNPLQYIHTGLMSALVLHLKAVDFVIGGCGTGLGYLNSVLQYPGVTCGHILTPLDAWLFARINAGNCVSLALNQGYGWAGPAQPLGYRCSSSGNQGAVRGLPAPSNAQRWCHTARAPGTHTQSVMESLDQSGAQASPGS